MTIPSFYSQQPDSLDSIDACLYYLSEPKEGDRELKALDKTEQEILAELSYGIPQQSDND